MDKSIILDPEVKYLGFFFFFADKEQIRSSSAAQQTYLLRLANEHHTR